MDFTTSELKCLWNMISISTVNRKADLNAIEKSVRSKLPPSSPEEIMML